MTVEILEDQFNLVETKEYPNYSKFPFEKFNPVQSRIFEIFKENCNLVVAAKTSAGKTICSEMVMAHEIREKGGKAMYLAPLRALAKEKIGDEVCIRGNTNTQILGSGHYSEMDVESEIKKNIETGKPGGRFMLAAGCETPWSPKDLAIRNLTIMKRMNEKLGIY